MSDEIKEKISVLKELNNELDNFDHFTDILVNNKEDYHELMEDINPKERMDLNWNLGFSSYTLYYIYLKLQNIDPRDHEIKDEMVLKLFYEIQDFYKKIQDAKEPNTMSTNNIGDSRINKETAERLIKNYTNNKPHEDNVNVRKLNRSVPLPEQAHLNWQKNIK